MKDQIKALAAKVADLTEWNSHTLAIREIAAFINDDLSVEICDWVEELHVKTGHISEALYSERAETRKIVLDAFEELHGADARALVSAAL